MISMPSSMPKDDEGEDLLALFLGTSRSAPTEPAVSAEITSGTPLSLYPGSYEYCAQALGSLNAEREQVHFSADYRQTKHYPDRAG